MGTRGFIGFVADGRETVAYNRFDSYPDGLGLTVLDFARSVTDWPTVRKAAAALVHVFEDVPPTDEQIEVLERVSGDPAALLEAGYACHLPDWPGASLYCEWGYLLDLDAEVLEVYEGFQRAPHTEGRFHDRPRDHDAYWPVRRVASWGLDALPDDEAFVAQLQPEDE
jgi:hypothetical protein